MAAQIRISIRTAGTLGRYLPSGSAQNTATLDVAEGATPADVMAQLGMPGDGSYLVVLNGKGVPKAERATRCLAEDDDLAIMPPLRGG
jgi:sulfur carrier protein ThiS